MKKTLMNVKVTIVTNDKNESAGRKVMNGAMSMSRDAKEMQKIIPNTNALSVAGSENGLNKPLEDWLSGKYDEQLGDYLPIARCILESITDESLSYPPKA